MKTKWLCTLALAVAAPALAADINRNGFENRKANGWSQVDDCEKILDNYQAWGKRFRAQMRQEAREFKQITPKFMTETDAAIDRQEKLFRKTCDARNEFDLALKSYWKHPEELKSKMQETCLRFTKNGGPGTEAHAKDLGELYDKLEDFAFLIEGDHDPDGDPRDPKGIVELSDVSYQYYYLHSDPVAACAPILPATVKSAAASDPRSKVSESGSKDLPSTRSEERRDAAPRMVHEAR